MNGPGVQKYIVVKKEGQEKCEIFTFPKTIMHVDFMDCIRNIRVGKGIRDWDCPYGDAEVISAGYVDANGICFDGSASLDVESRGEIDTKLLRGEFVE